MLSESPVNPSHLVNLHIYVRFFLGLKRMLKISYSTLKFELHLCLVGFRKGEKKVCAVIFIFLVVFLFTYCQL